MKKTSPRKKVAEAVPQERTHFLHMLAKNPNYFGNIPGSKVKANFKQISNTTYEQLTCVGYNPDTAIMEATFSIKRSTGYSGNICTNGSFEYVRFYIDFHDGNGLIDQGSVAVNVHDIPAGIDCHNQSTLPVTYVASLKKKTGKYNTCSKPVLPTLRAILSWSIDPPPDSPNWPPVWGSVMDCAIQLKPVGIFPDFDIHPNLSEFLELAVASPDLSAKQIAGVTGVELSQLQPQPASLSLEALKQKYAKARVPASRFAFKTAYSLVQDPLSEVSLSNKDILSKLKIDITDLIDEIGVFVPVDKSKANVDYEELECVGLDYHTDTLVATLAIKKNLGYAGNLCDDGSKEYIAFWIDWDDSCKWEYIDTVELNVHDLEMKGDKLCYSVTLPLDTKYHKKLCNNPNIVRVRGVLSWNVLPSTTNPDLLQYYGNRVDAHVQIKPGPVINPGDVIPLFNIIGGIDVDHVNDATGLTKPGAFFAYNGLSVPTAAPFGGVIVLNGPSFPGYRYRIKITNLVQGTFRYADESFLCVGYLPFAPWVQYTTQTVDGDGYYPFLDPAKNTLNVLARFTPGTDDKFLVEMDVDTVPGVFSKTIRMDNTPPKIQLQVNDGGDCTHYTKGATITGHFYVNDLHISSWGFGSTWGGGASGTTNTPPLPGTSFSIPTTANAYPCGRVSLWAIDKAILNSQSVGHYVSTAYNICLQ